MKNPLKFRSFAAALACLALATGLVQAQAQSYPTKPITFVVPFAAGSATDNLARVLSEQVSTSWKQPVVIDNKPGASGFIAAQQVANAKPDGYTVFITSNTTHASNSALFKQLPYDPVKDYEPISVLGTVPLAMVIHPSIPAKTVKELIAYGKANPGKLSFGSGSTSSRMAGEMFKSMAGIDMVNIQYKSNPQAVTDLLGGQIQLVIADAVTTMPHAKAGKIRAIAISTAKRSPIAPELPTVAESGLPGYEMIGWFAAYVPAKTPKDIVTKLNKELVRILSTPEAKDRLAAVGIETMTSTPEGLAEFQRVETAKWAKLVKAAGIVPE
jgi:tripartite-type tricarboxylate transporter receptor subunit TctC